MNKMPTLITGSGIAKARFGTAIAAIGDVNLDGYQGYNSTAFYSYIHPY